MDDSRVEEVVLAYAAVWSEPDRLRRAALIVKSLAPDAEIVGPGYCFKGHQAISSEVERFHSSDPGARVVLASGITAHSGWARFAVAMVAPNGEIQVLGEDLAAFGEDGRIITVLTFWGALPPIPANWPSALVAPGK